MFTVEFKAEVVRHKKAENLTPAECRRAVSPEPAEITRLRAELSRSRMEVSILKKAAAYFARESL